MRLANTHARVPDTFLPRTANLPRLNTALKKFQTWGGNKKFHNTKIYLEPISLVRVDTNQDRGGNHVADPCLNSSGFRYHIEYFGLMAHRVVREEGARKLEHERRP